MKTEMIEGEIVGTGSGDVFADLGLPDADKLLLKAQLMHAINTEIERRGPSQADAGDS